MVQLICINCSYVTVYAAAPMELPQRGVLYAHGAGRPILHALLLALIDMPYSVYGRFVGV
jgi:hypothetical protein